MKSHLLKCSELNNLSIPRKNPNPCRLVQSVQNPNDYAKEVLKNAEPGTQTKQRIRPGNTVISKTINAQAHSHWRFTQ